MKGRLALCIAMGFAIGVLGSFLYWGSKYEALASRLENRETFKDKTIESQRSTIEKQKFFMDLLLEMLDEKENSKKIWALSP